MFLLTNDGVLIEILKENAVSNKFWTHKNLFYSGQNFRNLKPATKQQIKLKGGRPTRLPGLAKVHKKDLLARPVLLMPGLKIIED